MLELSVKVKGLGKHSTRTLSLIIQGVRFRKKTAKKYISIQQGVETENTINFGGKLSFILSFLFPDRLHCCYIYFHRSRRPKESVKTQGDFTDNSLIYTLFTLQWWTGISEAFLRCILQLVSKGDPLTVASLAAAPLLGQSVLRLQSKLMAGSMTSPQIILVMCLLFFIIHNIPI
jgi:hypothetical protein